MYNKLMAELVMCRVGYGPSLYVPSWLWTEFVWAELVMGRVCHGPSLLWAEMSSYRTDPVFAFNTDVAVSFLLMRVEILFPVRFPAMDPKIFGENVFCQDVV